MRMWNVPTSVMCRKHLLGEHLEMHMFHGCISKGKSLSGYVQNGLVELERIKTRHDELMQEMIVRGYKHKSPMDFDNNSKGGNVSVIESVIELERRCPECRERM